MASLVFLDARSGPVRHRDRRGRGVVIRDHHDFAFRDRLAAIEWNKAAISAAIKDIITAHSLKMPQLAHAVRVLVCGRAQTPSIDAVLELFPRETVLARLRGA